MNTKLYRHGRRDAKAFSLTWYLVVSGVISLIFISFIFTNASTWNLWVVVLGYAAVSAFLLFPQAYYLYYERKVEKRAKERDLNLFWQNFKLNEEAAK